MRRKKKRRKNPKPRAITDRAREIIFQGAANSPDRENTRRISTWYGAATCFRIFRQRNFLNDSKETSRQCIRDVKEKWSP